MRTMRRERGTMFAATIRAYGGPEVLNIEEIPIPQPAANEVLIEVDACGVNYQDIDLRKGVSRRELAFPFVLGREIVGTVVRGAADGTCRRQPRR